MGAFLPQVVQASFLWVCGDFYTASLGMYASTSSRLGEIGNVSNDARFVRNGSLVQKLKKYLLLWTITAGLALVIIITIFWDICVIQFNPSVTVSLVMAEIIPLRYSSPDKKANFTNDIIDLWFQTYLLNALGQHWQHTLRRSCVDIQQKFRKIFKTENMILSKLV